ncbi:hypothetical protein JRG18_04955 [Kocuria palustris]|uniref:hypothetical protein n=1 Tax=Kocuria palustris TaxID=71999 RepID=UPI0019D206F1|nr:hypothetical protein [Kocuria palustris]MBN6757828.1 hypothetical protein [Kocuria palustris]MBN6762856.1 hypothetical protein [Kocuria palustris]MBN6782603.1 hypothetical protein [Kocuria palustris]MBN6799255.1 hypothetical protein [Kocuria palustris]MBN6816327.1 hypothetical protein [Kocuria palustris]
MNWYQQTIWHTIEFSNNRRPTSPFHQAHEDQVLQPPQLTRPEPSFISRSPLCGQIIVLASSALHNPAFSIRSLAHAVHGEAICSIEPFSGCVDAGSSGSVILPLRRTGSNRRAARGDREEHYTPLSTPANP